jgi:hypothetical protein
VPFRFRRSFRLAPGIRLNIGRGGVSTSIGERGAHVTVGHGRTRATVTVPGSGLSYTAGLPTAEKTSRRSPHVTWGAWLFGAAIALILLWWFGWL